jgi:hypothetical protein
MTAPDDTVIRSTGARRKTRLWVAAAVIVVVGAGCLLLVSYGMYKQWPWSDYPSTLYACGRDFIDEGVESREQIEANGDRLVRLGSVPGWLNHGQLWTTSLGEPLPDQKCHVVMWVRTGRDAFESYSLSGAP